MRVNGKLELFANAKVFKGQKVTCDFRRESQVVDNKLDTIFEDDAILVISKKPGQVCDEKMGLLVHRLDKETSGVLVIAKTETAQKDLEKQFRERSVEKVYYALVEGNFPKKLHIETKMRKKCVYDGQTIWCSGRDGKEAITDFEKVLCNGGVSLVKCFPKTGRTHQIRVHLAEAGFPILGDDHYWREKPFVKSAPRVMLHAETIGFTHPTSGEKVSFTVKRPDEFFDC